MDSKKDNQISTTISSGERGWVRLSYSKTNKLITALYMVTDVLEEGEPIRHKLRTLGIEIISDIATISASSNVFNSKILTDTSIQLNKKVHETISFLEIAVSLGMISEMNFSILNKEFLGLKESIGDVKKDPNILDLLKEENVSKEVFSAQDGPASGWERIGPFKGHDIGHETTRIGVQKGSTLLNALSRVEDKVLSDNMSDKKNRSPLENKNVYKYNDLNNKDDFSILKNKRREEIISIIKDKVADSFNIDGITITDIKNIAHGLPINKQGVLATCGEKTLQRELISMVSEGILRKTGEKRWSTYSLSNTRSFLKTTKSILN